MNSFWLELPTDDGEPGFVDSYLFPSDELVRRLMNEPFNRMQFLHKGVVERAGREGARWLWKALSLIQVVWTAKTQETCDLKRCCHFPILFFLFYYVFN